MFKVGDTVEWTSSYKDKRGVIVHFLARGAVPYQAWGAYKAAGGKGRFIYGGGASRGEASYFVLVGKKVYWPRVSLLRKVET